MDSTSIFKIICGIAILAVIVFVCIANDAMYKQECEDFAKKKGCTVISTDTHVTAIGTPFNYTNKGTMIYEVKLSNGETWFMRPNLFGNDWEKGE